MYWALIFQTALDWKYRNGLVIIMSRATDRKGVIAVAFGAGLLFSCFCPTQALIAFLAILLVLLGFACLRC